MPVEQHPIFPKFMAVLDRLVEAKARLDDARPGDRQAAQADYEAALVAYRDLADEI